MIRIYSLFLAFTIGYFTPAYSTSQPFQSSFLENAALKASSFLSLTSYDQQSIPVIPLSRSYPGYLANLSLAQSANSSQNSIMCNSLNLFMALYTNDTIIFGTATNQSNIDPMMLDSPYLEGSGNATQVEILTSGNSTVILPAIIVNSSGYSGPLSQNGNNCLGYVGMSNIEALQPGIFSVYLDQFGQTGELMLGFKSWMAETEDPFATLSADSNWHINGLNTVSIGNTDFQVNTSLIFDINSDAIGLPLNIYNSVMQVLTSQYAMLCPSGVLYQPKCSSFANTDNFPDLTFKVGDQTIFIPSFVYVQNQYGYVDDDYIVTFNIKALSNNLTGPNFVAADYSNYFILNADVMQYYYTVFDSTKNTISLYIANQGSNDDLAFIPFIVLGWFGIFFIAAGIYYCYIKRKIRRNAQRNNGTGNTSLLANQSSSQVPQIQSQVAPQEQLF